jgi:hypothetical protein
MLAQCRIDAASPDQLGALALPSGSRRDTEREFRMVQRTRIRAIAHCRAGDFARAERLLEALVPYDDAIAGTLKDMLSDRTLAQTRAGLGAPTFPEDPTLSADAVAHAKQRFAGMRVMIVYRQLFPNRPERAYDPVDNLERSGQRFGLETRVVNSHYPPAGVEAADFAVWLQGEILAFRPSVIVYDDLFETGVSAWTPEIATQVATVLQGVRDLLGVRVVKSLLDAWFTLQTSGARTISGIGSSFDLLHHMQPSLTVVQSAIERARSFCYSIPFLLPAPTVPWGGTPRACFAGSISWASIARLAWRTEIGKRGLPFDFLESDHQAATLRSDQDYANIFHGYQLAACITRRSNGDRILLARSIEIPLSGGVLLEEASPNSAYFLAPGVHCEVFETIDQLAGLIDDLLASETRRRSLAEEGHRWVTEHFTGDRFWAGLLARLFT